jgi:predicted metalloprotease
MTSAPSVVVRHSRFCTFLKGLFAVQLLAVLAVGALLTPKLGENERSPRGPTEGQRDPRTYGEMVALALQGPDVPGSLANFWKATLEQAGARVTFQQPKFVKYRATFPNVGCNKIPNEGRNNAYYCYSEHKGKPNMVVAYDEDFLGALDLFQGRFAPLTLMAHEYGHHVSRLRHGWAYVRGPTAYSIQEELQADCFAGMYLRHVHQRFGLKAREAVEVGEKFFKIGDKVSYGGYTWFTPGRHGKPIERVVAFAYGFGSFGWNATERFHRCERRYRRYNWKEIARLGPHALAVPNADIDTVDRERVRITNNGIQAHLRHFSTSSAEATSVFIAGDEVSDVRTRLLRARKETSEWYGSWSVQQYERSYRRDGELVITHGELALLTLERGGVIGFDVFRPGSGENADQPSWQSIETYRRQLQEALSLAWNQG